MSLGCTYLPQQVALEDFIGCQCMLGPLHNCANLCCSAPGRHNWLESQMLSWTAWWACCMPTKLHTHLCADVHMGWQYSDVWVAVVPPYYSCKQACAAAQALC
jgi:hypothetical protein